MVDLKSRKCITPGCLRQPLYNFPGKKPEYCAAHREDAMINTKVRSNARKFDRCISAC